jgi:hypothetical protein
MTDIAHRSKGSPPYLFVTAHSKTGDFASSFPAVIPVAGGIRRNVPPWPGNNEQHEQPKDKNPSRINDLGFSAGLDGTSGDGPGPRYMWSIITWPKPEHDTWVAPGIRRAKS